MADLLLQSNLVATVCNTTAELSSLPPLVPHLDAFYAPFSFAMGACFCGLATFIACLEAARFCKTRFLTGSGWLKLFNALTTTFFGVFLLCGGGVHAPDDYYTRDKQIICYCLSWISFKVMVMKWIQRQHRLLVPLRSGEHQFSKLTNALVVLVPPTPSTIGLIYVVALTRNPSYACLPYASLSRRFHGFAAFSVCLVSGLGSMYLRRTTKLISWYVHEVRTQLTVILFLNQVPRIANESKGSSQDLMKGLERIRTLSWQVVVPGPSAIGFLLFLLFTPYLEDHAWLYEANIVYQAILMLGYSFLFTLYFSCKKSTWQTSSKASVRATLDQNKQEQVKAVSSTGYDTINQ